MKVSDYIMEFIAGLGVGHVFCVTGGGAMHMNDSLGRNQDLEGVFMLHEQGAAIAAEAFARVEEGYGICLVTSGPGGTNALTGLVGAYLDSIPVIFLSGQAKRDDLVGAQGIRQFGIQEVDIVSMARHYAKYAVQVDDPRDIRYELEKAASIAVSGRPGPVWLDIPLDIQAAKVEPASLKKYDGGGRLQYGVKESDIEETIRLFNQAKRPVLLIGHGVRLGHAVEEMRTLYEFLNVPVLVSWNGIDLIEECHPLYYGRPGMVGQRAANFIQQNADFVLTIGSRLGLLNTGYNYKSFLENAVHVMVDIDIHEMEKKSVKPALKVECDAKSFIQAMLRHKAQIIPKDYSGWISHCKCLCGRYQDSMPEYEPGEGFVSSYHLIGEISNQMSGEDIYQFTSSGTSADIAMKVFQIKRGQRAFLTKGLAAMGYDVPAAIGSCIGSGGKRTVCVTGDGSIAMNMQELEVIRRLHLPIKIFVSDNKGYSMIHNSQEGNFGGRLTGCTAGSGLTLPDMRRVAEAFGIRGMHIEDEGRLARQVREALEYDGPVVCTVNTDINQKVLPRQCNYVNKDGQMESRPLEDMAPLLSREELARCMSGMGSTET